MKAIKPEWKTAVLATWIIGLFAHAYRFFNFLPTGDTMHSFFGTGATYRSGRWFLDWASQLSTNYELIWVNAALSMIYICVAVVMLIELLEIKSKCSIILTAGLVVTFPAVTSTFAYMFTADGYMMAFMLAVAGIYLTQKYRWGVIPGALCVCLSMSTYQAYLSVSLVLVAIVCIKKVLLDDLNFVQALQAEYPQAIALAIGAVLNKVLTNLINEHIGMALTSYQGINDVHMLTIEDNLKAVGASWDGFKLFFMIGEWADKSRYSQLHQLFFVLLLGFTVYFVIKKKVYKRPLVLICVTAAYLCMPMLVYVIRFVSVKVVYHALMVMSLSLLYVFILMLIEHFDECNKLEKGMRYLTIAVMCGICYINILNANYAYYQMNLSYEKSYAIAMDVLSRVEEIEEFDGTQKIAVCGFYDATTEIIKPSKPELVGVSNGTVLAGQEHYLAMWEYCMGRVYDGATPEETFAVCQTKEYQDMNVYPYAGCVECIDGVVVVKLSEE